MMTQALTGTNPFTGLRPFGPDQHHLFFGREEQIDDLIRRLGQTRFLAVVGPSGSGKSSLIGAGLIPELNHGRIAEAGLNWKIAFFNPGRDPVHNMAETLRQAGVLGKDGEEGLRENGLVEMGRQSGLSRDENLLLVVDQFEELFRYSSEGGFSYEEAFAFVKLLLEVSRQREVSVYVVLTMRADFLGSCTLFQGLPEAINEGQYLIPSMIREQIRRAIEQPVAVADAEITPRLVQRLLGDGGDSPDQLPIMQHALMRTWDYWEQHGEAGQPLDEEHYEAIGTMEEALSQHAEEAYSELQDENSRRVAGILFKCLTFKASGGRGLRRPSTLGEACRMAGAEPDEVSAVVEPFRLPKRWFITPSSETPLHEDTVLDLSHESLMRVWKRLMTWVDEEADSAQLYMRLANTAALYQEGKARLYQDPDLELALNWQRQNRPTLAWAQRYEPAFERAVTFLEHSRKQRDFEVAHREEQQRRRLKRVRVFAASMGGASIIFLMSLIIAINLYYDAEESKIKAVEQREVAEKERRNAEQQQQIAVVQRKNAERLRLLSIARSLSIQAAKIQRTGQIELGALLALQGYLFNTRYGGSALDPDIYNGLNMAVGALVIDRSNALRGHEDEVRAVAFSPDASAVASAGEDGEVRLWKLHGTGPGYRILRGKGSRSRTIAFSPDGKLLAAGTWNSIWIWRLNSPEALPMQLGNQTSAGDIAVTSLAFDDTGRFLASASLDGKVRIWNLHDPAVPSSILYEGDGRLQAVAFGGRTLAWGSEDGHVRLMDMEATDHPPLELKGHQGPVNSLAFSPDGRLLVSGSARGAILVRDLENLAREPLSLIGHTAGITSVVFNPDSRLLVSGSLDKSLRIWDIGKPDEEPILIEHDAWVWSVDFSPDGKQVVSGSADKSVRLWTVPMEILASEVCGRIERNLDLKEWQQFVGADIPYEKTCANLIAGDGEKTQVE